MSNPGLQKYASEDGTVWFKVISARPHPFSGKSGQNVALGMAFRTADAPIGYLPFYEALDFDLDGSQSFVEKYVYGSIVGDGVASPHTALIRAAAGDVIFLGSGDPELTDIQQQVKRENLQNALTIAGGAFVDLTLTAIGGPTAKAIVGQFTKSALKKFLISQFINAQAKKRLKEYAGFK